MRFRTLPLTGLLTTGTLAAILLLTGCANTTGTTGTMPGMNHGSGGMTSSASAPTGESPANSVDQMFVTMMIPHHEQAVQMADQILAKDGIDQRVIALAEQIKAAQGPEIQTMNGWLEDWGIPGGSTSGMGSMSGMSGMDHGDGMMSDDDLAALDAATGTEAARLFLQGMIGHHQGAISMAESALKNGENSEVAALAQQIIDGQTTEIATMRDILATL